MKKHLTLFTLAMVAIMTAGAATLGAAAYRLICSSASCHWASALESLPSSGFDS